MEPHRALEHITRLVRRVFASLLAGVLLASAGSVSAQTDLSLVAKWNLTGNVLDTPVDVVTLFGETLPGGPTIPGVTNRVVSVWKWLVDPLIPACTSGCWAFFTPTQTKAQSDQTARDQGYQPLTTIGPAEGFWVFRTPPGSTTLSVPVQAGAPFSYRSQFNPAGKHFSDLKKNTWHLIAQSEALSASEFNLAVNLSPPQPNFVPTTNFVTLWAWDAVTQRWYFYAPTVEAAPNPGSRFGEPVGLPGVTLYCTDNNLLDFTNAGKMLGPNTGFWVRR